MKNHFIPLIAGIVLMTQSGSVFAESNSPQTLPEGVISEYRTAVGFAPPAYRGVYTVSVYENGAVVYVNNRGASKSLATLEPALVQALQRQMAEIEDPVQLDEPEGPRCSDAPSIQLVTRNSTGGASLIWKKQSCQERTASYSPAASGVSRILVDLSAALESLGRAAQ
jgi:hypothetical protein